MTPTEQKTFDQMREKIEKALIYLAHSGKFSRSSAKDVLNEALAEANAVSEPVGINGLTEAETSASMSVMGLSKPQAQREAVRLKAYLHKHKVSELEEGTCVACEGEGEIGGQFCGSLQECPDCAGTGKTLAHPQATEPAWRPIETAPKDGTAIIIAVVGEGVVYDVCNGHFEIVSEDEDDGPWDIRDGKPWCSYEGRAEGVYFCCWLPGKEWESRWRVTENFEYTHWMPLPAAPEAKQ